MFCSSHVLFNRNFEYLSLGVGIAPKNNVYILTFPVIIYKLQFTFFIVFVFEYRGGKLYKKIISRLSDESPKTADNASDNNNTETLIEPNEKQIIDKISTALEEKTQKISENDSEP